MLFVTVKQQIMSVTNYVCNKLLLLDVNLKHRFLDVHTLPKALKLTKCFQKKILSDLVIKLLILLVNNVFKASAPWADAFYKTNSPSVCPPVCLCVCSLLRYRLNVFLRTLPKIGCPIFLEIRNLWGKLIQGRGLRFKKKNS